MCVCVCVCVYYTCVCVCVCVCAYAQLFKHVFCVRYIYCERVVIGYEHGSREERGHLQCVITVLATSVMIVKNSLEKHMWPDGKKPQGITVKALQLSDDGVHTFPGKYGPTTLEMLRKQMV